MDGINPKSIQIRLGTRPEQMVDKAATSLLEGIRTVSQVASWIGGALLLGAALLIGIDVATRNWLQFSVPGTDELAGYALAIAGSWALTYALLSRAHIRVDSLYVLLPIKVRCALDLLGMVSLIVFFSLVARHAYGTLEQSIISGSRSQSELAVLLAIPQAAWFAGLTFFVVTALVVLVIAITRFVRHDYDTIQRTIGAKTIQEEVAEESTSLNR